MTDDKINSAVNRYNDNRVGRILFMLTMSLLVTGLLVCLVAWKTKYPTPVPYYMTTVNSHATPLSALDMPNQSDSALVDWASQAAVTTNTYDWSSWDTQMLQKARVYFSKEGWAQFTSAFEGSNTLANVLDKQLRVSSVVTKPPVIVSKGELLGAYTWAISVPLLISYESPGQVKEERLVVSMKVSRISTLESKEGIGITDYVLLPSGSIV